jgi:hypothetical protein
MKYTGIEIKKNEFPVKVKNIIRDVYEKVCREHWEEKDLQKYMGEQWNIYKALSFEEIAYFRGYNTEKESINFLQMIKGASSGSKAANYFNQLVEALNLKEKYELIAVGDKIRSCYIKANSYGISVLGFKDNFPDEFKPLFSPDYELMFQKMILKPLASFCKLLHWHSFDPRKAPVLDIFTI